MVFYFRRGLRFTSYKLRHCPMLFSLPFFFLALCSSLFIRCVMSEGSHIEVDSSLEIIIKMIKFKLRTFFSNMPRAVSFSRRLLWHYLCIFYIKKFSFFLLSPFLSRHLVFSLSLFLPFSYLLSNWLERKKTIFFPICVSISTEQDNLIQIAWGYGVGWRDDFFTVLLFFTPIFVCYRSVIRCLCLLESTETLKKQNFNGFKKRTNRSRGLPHLLDDSRPQTRRLTQRF